MSIKNSWEAVDAWESIVEDLKNYSNNSYVSVADTVQPSVISCNVGNTEMLRVSPDGFYVRGVKVPADDKEALTVYNAFKQFLVWSELNRR